MDSMAKGREHSSRQASQSLIYRETPTPGGGIEQVSLNSSKLLNINGKLLKGCLSRGCGSRDCQKGGYKTETAVETWRIMAVQG